MDANSMHRKNIQMLLSSWISNSQRRFLMFCFINHMSQSIHINFKKRYLNGAVLYGLKGYLRLSNIVDNKFLIWINLIWVYRYWMTSLMLSDIFRLDQTIQSFNWNKLFVFCSMNDLHKNLSCIRSNAIQQQNRLIRSFRLNAHDSSESLQLGDPESILWNKFSH